MPKESELPYPEHARDCSMNIDGVECTCEVAIKRFEEAEQAEQEEDD